MTSAFSLLPLKGVGGSHVFAMMREEKLFSAIHIAGTAMAIAFTMVMAVVYYIKLAPIYPEVNRMRTVYFNGINVVAKNGMGQTGFGGKAFEEWFQNSPNIEYCSPTCLSCGTGKNRGLAYRYVQLDNGDYADVITNFTSADFFKIYEYDFINGRPFTKQEVEADDKVCVISDALSERLFGKGADALGKLVELEHGESMRVVGVVRSGSQLTPDSYADIIRPYKDFNPGYVASYGIIVTVKDTEHLKALKKELDDIAARVTLNHEKFLEGSFESFFDDSNIGKVELTNEMEIHPMHVLRTSNRKDSFDSISNWQLIKHFAGVLFVLLFVPALNLCGIVAGRMERRTAEMAVRKTFGARRSTLLWHVVTENLVLTTIGGIIGLTAAWITIYGMRTEILRLFFDSTIIGSSPIVTGEMLFAPLLFVGAFVAVLLMNVLSALLPAWLSLRKPIVESMMEKR